MPYAKSAFVTQLPSKKKLIFLFFVWFVPNRSTVKNQCKYGTTYNQADYPLLANFNDRGIFVYGQEKIWHIN
jgi:hypothetical protein